MARIPNNDLGTTQSTMWKLNDVYVGRSGDVWQRDLTEACGFTMNPSGVLGGSYYGIANGDGSTIGAGSPLQSSWGTLGGYNHTDQKMFQITTNNSNIGSAKWHLDWLYWMAASTPYAQNITFQIRICAGNSLADADRVWENEWVSLSHPSAGAAPYNWGWWKLELPRTGSLFGSLANGLTYGQNYTIAVSWQTSWYSFANISTTAYAYQSHTLTNGSTAQIYWQTGSASPSQWGGKQGNGTTLNQGVLWGIGARVQ